MKGLRRSIQWVIGGDEATLQQALASQADAVCFELEDLCPAENKIKARETLVRWLSTVDFGQKEVGVRINSLDSEWGPADLEAIMPFRVDFIRLPKCEQVRDVLDVDAILTQYEATHQTERNTTELILMIESPLGVRNAYELASCSNRVAGLNLGAVDLTNSMGISRDLTPGSTQLLYAKQKLVMDAKAAGVAAFDTAVFCPPGRNDAIDEFVRRDTEAIKLSGFTGRSVSNLGHIDIINQVFSPSDQEIDFAKRAVQAFETASGDDKAHLFIDGRLIDKPVYESALKILAACTAKGALA